MIKRVTCGFAVVLVSFILGSTQAGERGTVSGAAWEKLRERLKDPAADKVKLRQDLLAFRRDFPGTPQAFEASVQLRALPSALDKLDPRSIPALERYDWQPKELVALLGEQRGRHGWPVYSVAYSSNGKWIASAGGSGVRVWDSATLRQAALLGAGSTSACAFSKDSSLLAAGDGYGSVHIWDVSGEKIKPQPKLSLKATSTAVYGVAFSPDGKLVACAGADLMVHVFNITEKEPKEVAKLSGHEKTPYAVVFSPSGKTLASSGYDGTVRLWDMAVARPTAKGVLKAHDKEVVCLAFNPEGTLLASGGYDGLICLWSMAAGPKAAPRNILKGKWGNVYGLAFSGSGKRLAAATSDFLIHQWDLVGNFLKERVPGSGHGGAVGSVVYAPKGEMLVSGGHDQTVRLWGVAGQKPVEKAAPRGHLSWVYAAAFSPDGFTLASGSLDTTQRWWNLSGPEPKEKVLPKGQDPMHIYSLSYGPDGKTIAAAGNTDQLRFYETTQGREVRRLKGHAGAVGVVSYSPDGRRLLSLSHKTLYLWDGKNPTDPRKCDGHAAPVNSAAWSADSRWVVTAGGNYLYKNGSLVVINGEVQFTDCCLRLWSAETARQVHLQSDFKKPVNTVAAAPHGARVYSGSYDADLRQWEIEAEMLKGSTAVKGTNGQIPLALISPDGKLGVTRGPDHSLMVWDLATGKATHKWDLPEYVGGVAIAPDSRHLAVGLGNGPIYILRLAEAK